MKIDTEITSADDHLTHFCLDINECRDGALTHRARSCTCGCDSGFHKNGISCNDLDEYAHGVHDRHPTAVCSNS